MSSKLVTQSALAALIIAFSLAGPGCAMESGSVDEENVATSQHAIVDGAVEPQNLFGTVALYHKKQAEPGDPIAWGTRPCSARVLNPTESKKAILTARHCVTLNAKPTGTVLLTPSQVRVTAALSPGQMPPSFVRTPFAIHDHPDPNLEWQRDLAVVWVEGDIQLPQTTTLVGLNVVDPEDLDGVQLIQLGYGWGKQDEDDTSNEEEDETTGILRSAYFFTITGIGPNATYKYPNLGSQSGGYVFRGDSGGPAIFSNATGPSFNELSVAVSQTGVHARITGNSDAWIGEDASVAYNWDKFLMPELGAIFLRSLASPERRINVSTTLNSSAKTEPNNTTSGNSMLSYSTKTGQVGVRNNPERYSGDSGRCLAVADGETGSGARLVVKTCSGTNSWRQIFRMNTTSQLVNPETGKCVRENSNHRLVLANCSSERAQRWIVDPDPR